MRVKICGVCRPGDAALAVRAGADLVGVILAPGFARTQTPAQAESILGAAGHAVRVGVFVDAGPEAIAPAERLRLGVLQLHGGESPERVAALAAAGPWRIWKAVRVRGGHDLREAIERYAGVAHGLLLEGWSAAAAGGTGARFDWDAAAPERARVPAGVEVIVGGGLTAGNVGEAVARLTPDVVDVSSGVESTVGRKSAAKMRAFVAAARTAAAAAR